MEVSPFFPLCEGLVVERVEHTATTLTKILGMDTLLGCISSGW